VNRARLQQRLERSWQAFRQSYAGLPDAEMLEPGVTGAWSVKDILAHVTTWEEEALKHLPLVLRGEKPPRYSVTHGGINAFNARTAARNAALSLAEVLQNLEETHRRLLRFLDTVPEDRMGAETRFRRRLRLDTYSHYPKHAEAIRQWREQRAQPR
jgi:hypothetical protein